MDLVKDKLNVAINYTKRGETESEAKRNNHTIAERIWEHYHKML